MSYTVSRQRIIEIIDRYQCASTQAFVRYPELLAEVRELLARETPDNDA